MGKCSLVVVCCTLLLHRLLFWAHNGRSSSNITLLKLNGLGERVVCTSGSSVNYLAIALDTVTMRIFWIREVLGSFELGTARYDDFENGCSDPVNRVMNNINK